MRRGVGFPGSQKMRLSSSLARARVVGNEQARIGVEHGTRGYPANDGMGGYETRKHRMGRESLGRYSSPFYTYLLLNPSRLNCTKSLRPRVEIPGGGKDPSLNIPQAIPLPL